MGSFIFYTSSKSRRSLCPTLYFRATSVSSHSTVTMQRQANVPTPLLDATRPPIRRANSPAHLWVATTPSNFAGSFPGHILQFRYRCYFLVRLTLSNSWANQDNNFHKTYGWGRHHVLHPWHFSSSYGDSCLARNMWLLTSRWLLFLSFSGLFIYQQPIFNAIRRLGYFGGFRQKAADTLNYNIVVQTTENKRRKKHKKLKRKEAERHGKLNTNTKKHYADLETFLLFPFSSPRDLMKCSFKWR